MITVIMHFHNEERMLPWWLRHHRDMFDHGILIDHGSTDRSVQICRELAPTWSVVPSKLTEFDAIETDFEVMNLESSIKGWKVALNATEFLVAPMLRETLALAEGSGTMAFRTHGAIMVDANPDQEPEPEKPLLDQKYHGYLEEGWRLWFVAGKKTRAKWRRRLIHRYPHGAYTPGRHSSFRPAIDAPPGFVTCWFGYSPWTDWFKGRKKSFVKRIPASDLEAGRGVSHMLDAETLEGQYRRRRLIAFDLRKRLEMQ